MHDARGGGLELPPGLPARGGQRASTAASLWHPPPPRPLHPLHTPPTARHAALPCPLCPLSSLAARRGKWRGKGEGAPHPNRTSCCQLFFSCTLPQPPLFHHHRTFPSSRPHPPPPRKCCPAASPLWPLPASISSSAPAPWRRRAPCVLPLPPLVRTCMARISRKQHLMIFTSSVQSTHPSTHARLSHRP